MAAISNNKFEVYEWIKKIIDSCETPIHLVKTTRLIRSFDKLHNDRHLYESLRTYKEIKWDRLFDRSRKYLRVDELFKKFLDNSEPDPDVIWNRDQFVNMLLTDDEFHQKWGEECCEELTKEERYQIWFKNNYETGMEYNPSMIPDYDNEYYEPTPKRKLR